MFRRDDHWFERQCNVTLVPHRGHKQNPTPTPMLSPAHPFSSDPTYTHPEPDTRLRRPAACSPSWSSRTRTAASRRREATMVQVMARSGRLRVYGVTLHRCPPLEYEGAAAAARAPTISQTPLKPVPIIPPPVGSQGFVGAARPSKFFFPLVLWLTY